MKTFLQNLVDFVVSISHIKLYIISRILNTMFFRHQYYTFSCFNVLYIRLWEQSATLICLHEVKNTVQTALSDNFGKHGKELTDF